jgi:hypothetical protein
MEEKIQIDLVSADAVRNRKWLMLALAVTGVIIGVFGSRGADNWLILICAVGWMAWPGRFYLRFHRLERLLRKTEIAAQIEKFRCLRSGDFGDTCSELARLGSLIKQEKVVMGSPMTWGKKQGLASFDCGLFEVSVYEKNGRVGDLRVFVKNLRAAAL